MMVAQQHERIYYHTIVHLKMVKRVNIIFCVFYHNLKNLEKKMRDLGSGSWNYPRLVFCLKSMGCGEDR